MRLIDGDKLGEGDPVRLKRTGEMERIVHIFSVHPFKGNVVVLMGKRRELCSVDEVDKTVPTRNLHNRHSIVTVTVTGERA